MGANLRRDEAARVRSRDRKTSKLFEETITDLNAERDVIREEVAELELLLAETTDPDQFSRLLSQKVSIEALLQPQLEPLDRQIREFGVSLGELQGLTLVLQDGEVSARVARTASEPSSPTSPNLTRNLMVGALLGLAVGIGLPFVRHSFDEKLEDPGDISQIAGLPVLGAIPTFDQGDEPIIEVLENPGSVASEHYQALLTGMEFASIGEPLSSVLLTSAVPGEGKSTTALNIASLAAQYQNVLLIDADLRRPTIHEYVGAPNRFGLSDVLAGHKSFIETRLRHEQKGTAFDVLLAGPPSVDPALLLRGDAWPRLLDDLFLYDLIIIDGPPVLAVTDALLIGHARASPDTSVPSKAHVAKGTRKRCRSACDQRFAHVGRGPQPAIC